MNKHIVGVSNISAGWLTLNIWDFREDRIRGMRVSYLTNFFDDLLMSCKFLLSNITRYI